MQVLVDQDRVVLRLRYLQQMEACDRLVSLLNLYFSCLIFPISYLIFPISYLIFPISQ